MGAGAVAHVKKVHGPTPIGEKQIEFLKADQIVKAAVEKVLSRHEGEINDKIRQMVLVATRIEYFVDDVDQDTYRALRLVGEVIWELQQILRRQIKSVQEALEAWRHIGLSVEVK